MRPVASLVACAIPLVLLSVSSANGEDTSGGAQLRIASFGGESSTHFAASIQPSAENALLASVSDPSADVVVVVDTSASQSGAYRRESLSALEKVVTTLRSTDSVRIFAADVDAVAMSDSLAAPGSAATSSAIENLERRLPLGNTNMIDVIDAVRGTLVSTPRDHTRSIVYIGDGASIDATGNEHRFGALIDALRADHISVHSVAIGPSTNVELMAVLANQTGGVLGVVNEADGNTAAAIARRVTESSVRSPIWVEAIRLPETMTIVHGNRIPPLRVDRDSILLGNVGSEVKEASVVIQGTTPTANVSISADTSIEQSHPDFAFLPGLVQTARNNQGLTLPTAGSYLLRQTAKLLTAQSGELVRAGKLALQRGNKQGAKAIAEMALEADPNNAEAQSLKKVSETRLIMQNGSPFDDIFGDPPADASCSRYTSAGNGHG